MMNLSCHNKDIQNSPQIVPDHFISQTDIIISAFHIIMIYLWYYININEVQVLIRCCITAHTTLTSCMVFNRQDYHFTAKIHTMLVPAYQFLYLYNIWPVFSLACMGGWAPICNHNCPILVRWLNFLFNIQKPKIWFILYND